MKLELKGSFALPVSLLLSFPFLFCFLSVEYLNRTNDHDEKCIVSFVGWRQAARNLWQDAIYWPCTFQKICATVFGLLLVLSTVLDKVNKALRADGLGWRKWLSYLLDAASLIIFALMAAPLFGAAFDFGSVRCTVPLTTAAASLLSSFLLV